MLLSRRLPNLRGTEFKGGPIPRGTLFGGSQTKTWISVFQGNFSSSPYLALVVFIKKGEFVNPIYRSIF